MGISYYNKEEYFPAARHLEKARKFNAEDQAVNEYLYHSYLRCNRTVEASALRPPEPAAGGSGISVTADGGYALSSDAEPGNLATLAGNDSIYGEQDLYGNYYFSHAGVKVRVFSRVDLGFSYTYLSFDKTKYYQYGHPEARLDSISDNPFSLDYRYSFPWIMHDTAIPYRVKQQEGHFSADFKAPGGVLVGTGLHLVHTRYPLIRQEVTDSVTDTAFFLKTNSTWHLFSYPSAGYRYSLSDTSFTNWVVSLALSKQVGRVETGLTGSWSNLNGMTQWQAGASLAYYPLGNMDLYGKTAGTLFMQSGEKRLLFSQSAGGRILPWLWGEADLLYGDYTNANISGGSVVYNNSDLIRYRLGASLVAYAGKHLRITAAYRFFSKESRQYYYIKTEDPVTMKVTETLQSKTNPYTTNTIIIGLTWNL